MFVLLSTRKNTVVLAQLVRAPDCGSGGRGFEPHIPPIVLKATLKRVAFFYFRSLQYGIGLSE